MAYLVTGVFVPKALYLLTHYASSASVRRIAMLLGALMVAATGFIAAAVGWSPPAAVAAVALVGGLGLVARGATTRLRRAQRASRARTLTEQARVSYDKETFVSWPKWAVAAEVREAVESRRGAGCGEEIVIGRIDRDARVLGVYGELPGVDNIGEAEFENRRRYLVDLVLIGDHVLIRKDFRGNRAGFVNEWHTVVTLYGKALAPAVYLADEENARLYLEFIPGPTMGPALSEAKTLDKQSDNDPELEPLSENFLTALEDELDKIHACAVACLDTTPGNVIINPATGVPRFVGFEIARVHRSTSSPLFLFHRDRDRTVFNRTYDRNLMTEKSARVALEALTSRANEESKHADWYGPIDFGNGLTVGSVWSTDTGMGRWEYLNRGVMAPLVRGKRVLDLGSNNGVMPMMMLRAGASEVVGFEYSSDHIEAARVVHKLFEWRDMRRYRFEIRNSDMLAILHDDLGGFDLVTALCSLYYLSVEDMARVVRRAFELAPTVVLQANVDTPPTQAQVDPSDPREKEQKSSIPFLKQLLEENGFPNVAVHAPKGFSRPLLVGSAASSEVLASSPSLSAGS